MARFICLTAIRNSRQKKEYLKTISLAWAWSASGETGQITHRFNQGQLFKLGVTGYSDQEEVSVNAFRAKISVKPAEKPEPM